MASIKVNYKIDVSDQDHLIVHRKHDGQVGIKLVNSSSPDYRTQFLLNWVDFVKLTELYKECNKFECLEMIVDEGLCKIKLEYSAGHFQFLKYSLLNNNWIQSVQTFKITEANFYNLIGDLKKRAQSVEDHITNNVNNAILEAFECIKFLYKAARVNCPLIKFLETTNQEERIKKLAIERGIFTKHFSITELPKVCYYLQTFLQNELIEYVWKK